MTKLIRAATAAAILTSAFGSVGCMSTGRGDGHGAIGDHWRNAVDPCYPERYNHAARQATLAPFAQQVHNGHVLNQTLYTYHFEAGTDKLTPAGIEKLDAIARTRPAPDPKLFIQSATDITVTEANAAKIVDLRTDLEAKRAAAIQKYLATVPTFGPVSYEIAVHNPATPGIAAEPAASAYRSSFQGYRGGISGAAGIGTLGTNSGTNLTVAPVINSAGSTPPTGR